MMKADFWDVVQARDDAEDVEVRGLIGYVAGIGGEHDDPERSIGVLFYSIDRLWCLRDDEIVVLGYKDEIAWAQQAAWSAQGRSLSVRGDDGTVVD